MGVEIEQTTDPKPFLNFKEVQRLSVNTTHVFEKTRVNVTNSTGGTYRLVFNNPKLQGEYNYSAIMTDKATALEFENAVRNYYVYEFGSNVTVALELYDEQLQPTTDLTLPNLTYSYIITLTKLIKGQTVDGLMVAKITSAANFAYDLPATFQLSKPPLEGNYKIKCTRADGTFTETAEMAYNTWEGGVANLISIGCYGMLDKVRVRIGRPGYYWEHGFFMTIEFWGYNEDPMLYEIIPATVLPPLKGDPDVALNTTKANLMEYSSNIFYRAIPFELLKTFETLPQVIVNVGKHPAVCHS